MELNNYRTSKRHQEIVTLLEKMEEDCDVLTVWQNLNGKDRLVIPSVVWKLDKVKKTIILSPTASADPAHLQKNMMLYLHGSECSIVFKCDKFDVRGGKLLLSIPKEIKVVDHRKNPRFNISTKEDNVVVHKKEIGLAGSERYKHFIIACYDISQTGISFELHRNHLLRYRAGDLIEIISIAGIEIDDGVAEVVYICPLSIEGNIQRFKAGLKFIDPLSSELITRILLRVSE